jgi:hypothetical protein
VAGSAEKRQLVGAKSKRCAYSRIDLALQKWLDQVITRSLHPGRALYEFGDEGPIATGQQTIGQLRRERVA